MGSGGGIGSSWRLLVPVLPIIAGFVLISAAFSVTVPLLEAPDEPSHVAMVRYIAANHALPIQHPPAYFPVGQEGSQPPLYYALGAALFALSPGPSLAPTFDAHNPFVSFDRAPPGSDNRNLYAHTPREGFPYRGDVLGIHLVRALGILLGGATVLLTFLIGREVFPERPLVAALAAGLVAFNPEFAFVSGVVNNDGAITTATTFVLWRLIRWCRRGGTTASSLVLGAGLGAALLSKTDGILLIPFVLLALVADAKTRRGGWSALGRVALVLGVAAGSAGWWFARNWILYGDLLGWDAMLAANASMLRHPPLDLLSALQVLWRARDTFWGAFGWTNLLLPSLAYRCLDALGAIALVGLAACVRHQPRWPAGRPTATDSTGPARAAAPRPAIDPGRAATWLILGVWPLAVVVSLARWVQLNEAADQWRLVFPAIAPIGVLLALGLDEIRRLGRVPLQRRLAPRAILGVAATSPAHPPGTNGHLTTAAGAAVVGSRFARITVNDPSRSVRWAGDPRTGGESRETGRPAPRSAELTNDRARSPLRGTLTIATCGVAANLLVLGGIVAPAYAPAASPVAIANSDRAVRFGDAIELLAYRVSPARLRSGDPVAVDLDWTARSPVERNWAVAVGIAGVGEAPLARVQSWPQGGRAPTTAWVPGRIYHDHYVLRPRWSSTEPRLASVWLNLYDASVPGGPSLPVSDSAGHPIGTGIVVGTIKLAPTEPSPVQPTTPVNARFGSAIDLLGYDMALDRSRLTVTLYWRDLAPPPVAYTVFVHVAEADGRVVAQHDGPPRDGAYPTTTWERGEIIRDSHTIDLHRVPAGHYRVLVGLYDPGTGQRLDVRTASGATVPHDALPLFELDQPESGGQGD